MKRKKGFFIFFIFLGAFGSMIALSFHKFGSDRAVSVISEKKGHGKAAIGGDFDLITSKGEVFTQENLKGKWSLLYFGYTFCPDICPMALENISKAINKMPPPYGSKFQPVFVSVDPERDTPKNLAGFIKNFHPSWVAVSGTKEQVRTVKKAYKVYTALVEDENKNTPYYMIDHSSLVYIMNPEGEYVGHFTHETPPDDIVSMLKKIIRN